jgi:hypothetical protein
VKINLRRHGAATFVGFLLYSKPRDSYLLRVDFPDGVLPDEACSLVPEKAMLFASYEDAAMSMPGKEAGLIVVALYDNGKRFIVQTV